MAFRQMHIALLKDAKSPLTVISASKYTAPDYLQQRIDNFKTAYWQKNIKSPRKLDVAKLQTELLRKKNKEVIESEHDEDLMKFNSKITTLEGQLESLQHRGFLRAYKSYNPPADLDQKFTSCISKVLEKNTEDLSSLMKIKLTDKETKLKVLNALNKEFSHRVHNSRLHMMRSVGHLYTYYKSPISTNTPYEKLHDDMVDGNLPDNLVVQLEAIRFTGEGGHPLNEVTAFPRRDSVVLGMKARDQVVVKKKPSRYQETDYN